MTSCEMVQDEGAWDSEFCVDARQYEAGSIKVVGAITAVTQQTSSIENCTDLR